MAVLSVEVAEVQVDCLHRLLGALCAAPRGVELLCRLPFAQNLAVRRGGEACCCREGVLVAGEAGCPQGG